MQSRNTIRNLARLSVLVAASAIAVPSAFAGDCSAKEAESVGMMAAGVVRQQVASVVSIEGKEMMNLFACKTKGANFDIEYKYNFMGPDGYYWAEGEGVVTAAGDGSALTFTKLSDKLKSAAAAKNVVLASR